MEERPSRRAAFRVGIGVRVRLVGGWTPLCLARCRPARGRLCGVARGLACRPWFCRLVGRRFGFGLAVGFGGRGTLGRWRLVRLFLGRGRRQIKRFVVESGQAAFQFGGEVWLVCLGQLFPFEFLLVFLIILLQFLVGEQMVVIDFEIVDGDLLGDHETRLRGSGSIFSGFVLFEECIQSLLGRLGNPADEPIDRDFRQFDRRLSL